MYAIVRRLRRARRIEANPFVRCGMPFEESVIFRLTVDEEIRRLDHGLSRAIHALADGATMGSAALQSGMSTRTMMRCLDRLEARDAPQA